MLNLESIGKKIVKQRKIKGLTQSELADTLYVTHQAVSKWENGKSIPSIEVLIELTTLFDITIDYLLDNSEINEKDYKQMFKQFSREVVVSKYLNSEDPNKDLDNIFYLLSPTERFNIIELIIAGNTPIKVDKIWSYLNRNERIYLLGVILSNKLDYDVSIIFSYLSHEEQIMCQTHCRNGRYKYQIPNFYYGKGVTIHEKKK